ncbi:MAG: hypothetical protein MRZ53_00255 [Oscillospiraceae bacterium]|nr:hypothetical protein [Oscillospiraceae bacterium]
MDNLILDKKTGVFRAGNMDFGCGALSGRLVFSESGNTSLATVYADGMPIGTAALSSDAEARTEAVFPIDRTEGIREVTVTLDGSARLHSLTFSAEPAFGATDYVPTPEKKLIDLGAQDWEATDMLGRRVASVEDVRGRKKDRKVGIFYWTWRESHAHLRPVDVVDVLEKYPAAEYRKDHPAWGERPFQCHWHEPFYGFYRNSDPWVIRHHAALLAAAGVDMIMFDCTNGALLWRDAYEPLLRGLHEAREDGIRTPQVAFMMNFCPAHSTELMLRALYQNLYKPGLYSDLWFRLDGKPLVMAYPDALPETGVCETDTRLLNEIRDFFTFRPGQPMYAGGAKRPDLWGWLEVFPQNKYVTRPDGSCELVTVGVGQNANAERICTHFNDRDTFGRSYTGRDGFAHLSPDSYKYGYNVQEQWDRAIDLDPDIVFVTGWNEWIMGQFHEPWLSDNDSTQLAMVDQYDREHSRDIEMDRDGYLDTYYLQLAHNIRRFKGAGARQPVSAEKTITVRGGGKQWRDVTPVFRSPRGLTLHRDWDGFGNCHYVNTSGRNDILEARVARDADTVFFRVTCAAPITPREGEGWMTLFLNTDRRQDTGWEGYDLVINRLPAPAGRATVEAYRRTAEPGSFTWQSIGRAVLHVSGNSLTLALPRSFMPAGKLNFEFKWSDHMQQPTVMDFYENGSAAPIGRFNFLYRE